MSNATRIITLLTDFGMRDQYVASMKGVMLGLNPDLMFIDMSHLVPPQDIHSGAFILGQSYACFPMGTIHLAVVDPEVGTARRAVIVFAGGYFFIAPDNGLLTYVLEKEGEFTAHEITADHYFRKPVSATFHGRDVFAPVAAWISRDIPLHQFGPPLETLVRLKIPAITRVRDVLLQGSILAADGFGNLVTNLMPDDVPAYSAPGSRRCKLLVAGKEITGFRKTFGEGSPGELFVVPGSSGYLEIVVRNGSAASMLNLAPGAPIGVVLS